MMIVKMKIVNNTVRDDFDKKRLKDENPPFSCVEDTGDVVNDILCSRVDWWIAEMRSHRVACMQKILNVFDMKNTEKRITDIQWSFEGGKQLGPLKEELVPYFGFPKDTTIGQKDFMSCRELVDSYFLSTMPSLRHLYYDWIEVLENDFRIKAPFWWSNPKEYIIPKFSRDVPYKKSAYSDLEKARLKLWEYAQWYRVISVSNTSVNIFEHLFYQMLYWEGWINGIDWLLPFEAVLASWMVQRNQLGLEEFCDSIDWYFWDKAYILWDKKHTYFVRKIAKNSLWERIYEVYDPYGRSKWYNKKQFSKKFKYFFECSFSV